MTTDVDTTYLESFPQWLRTLGDDLSAVAPSIADKNVPEGARKALVAALNYVFKSIDLIPDGIDDIGYLDDAFVLRVAAAQAVSEGLTGDPYASIARLAGEAEQVKSFLGAEFGRFDHYVQSLRKGAARGRTVDDIVANETTRSEFVADVSGFARSYQAPSFTREEKTLIKLRAFFDAKLPH